MSKITELSLFVINRVRFRRFVLGISSRSLSDSLGHSSSYVGMMESNATKDQYPPHEYPKLAESLKFTVHDLLPPDHIAQNSTGKLVEKKVLNLDLHEDQRQVVEGLIAYGYFDRPKTLVETAKHLFIEKKKQLDLLQAVIGGIVKDGHLKLKAKEYYRDIV